MDELIKHETYDGTLESLKLMVENLKIEPNTYIFNIKTGAITILSHRVTYRPGDVYIYRLPKEYCAIG